MTANEQVRAHEFDGIREFDNRLPNWWLWSFYLAIVFAFLYWGHYHVLRTGALPMEELANEIELAESKAPKDERPLDDDALVQLSHSTVALERAKKIWEMNCVQCHRADGGGSVGPNLTDAFWIHGAKPTEILQTIRKGVPEKGMPVWELQLGSKRVQQIAAYVLTLRNTNAKDGKAPEGKQAN